MGGGEEYTWPDLLVFFNPFTSSQNPKYLSSNAFSGLNFYNRKKVLSISEQEY